MRFPYSLLFICTLGLAGPALGQQLDPNQTGAAAQANLNTLVSGAPTMVPKPVSEGLVGSPYADRRWLTAQLVLATQRSLPPVFLKYDVLQHSLLMLKPAPSHDSLQLNDAAVAGFTLLEPASAVGPARSRPFRRFAEGAGAERNDFVEVLHQGRFELLKHYRKTLKKAQLTGPYATGDRRDEIQDEVSYYLRTPTATLLPVKLTLKSLQAAAPDLAVPLKAAAAAQKPKTEADWGSALDAADPAPAK